MAYYYLMAQLPSISLNTQNSISFSYFKELAQRFLSEKDSKILNNLSLEPPRKVEPTGSSFLDNWYKYERSLRLSLAQSRVAKLNWSNSFSNEDKELMAQDYSASQVAKNAVTMENPLEAELFLDEARFIQAERMQQNENFSNNAVFAYGIKLLLKERNSKFQVEKGREEYHSMYNKILNQNKETGSTSTSI